MRGAVLRLGAARGQLRLEQEHLLEDIAHVASAPGRRGPAAPRGDRGSDAHWPALRGRPRQRASSWKKAQALQEGETSWAVTTTPGGGGRAARSDSEQQRRADAAGRDALKCDDVGPARDPRAAEGHTVQSTLQSRWFRVCRRGGREERGALVVGHREAGWCDLRGRWSRPRGLGWMVRLLRFPQPAARPLAKKRFYSGSLVGYSPPLPPTLGFPLAFSRVLVSVLQFFVLSALFPKSGPTPLQSPFLEFPLPLQSGAGFIVGAGRSLIALQK